MSEGWNFARIQTESCPYCGFNPAEEPLSSLPDLLISEASAWRDFLLGTELSQLQHHTEPEMWSPLENGVHVRDMLKVFGDRIQLAVAEEDPAPPWFDPGSVDYNAIKPLDLADEIQQQAERLRRIIVERKPSDWSRSATRERDPRLGSEGHPEMFTVAGLARYAVHEVHHHLRDAQRRSPLG